MEHLYEQAVKHLQALLLLLHHQTLLSYWVSVRFERRRLLLQAGVRQRLWFEAQRRLHEPHPAREDQEQAV